MKSRHDRNNDVLAITLAIEVGIMKVCKELVGIDAETVAVVCDEIMRQHKYTKAGGKHPDKTISEARAEVLFAFANLVAAYTPNEEEE
jgi:hypothetical protein